MRPPEVISPAPPGQNGHGERAKFHYGENPLTDSRLCTRGDGCSSQPQRQNQVQSTQCTRLRQSHALPPARTAAVSAQLHHGANSPCKLHGEYTTVACAVLVPCGVSRYSCDRPTSGSPCPSPLLDLGNFIASPFGTPGNHPAVFPCPSPSPDLGDFDASPGNPPWVPLPKSVAGLGCSPPNLGSILFSIPSGEMK